MTPHERSLPPASTVVRAATSTETFAGSHRAAPPRRLRSRVRWAVAAVVTLHGLLHLVGAVKGLGWADVPSLSLPVSTVAGVMWLLAAALVITAAVMLALARPRWWVASAVAAVVSQTVITSSWADAGAGTAVNIVLLVAAVYGYASVGPRSLHAEYRRRVSDTLALQGPATDVVTETDLAALPSLVAGYLRRSGCVGRPRVTSVRAHIHGRIRAEGKPWMAFVGEQVNTYGVTSERLFFIDASMRGLPVDVLHVFAGSGATMRVKAASLITMVDASGPAMDRAETVTLFNDMCVLAPAALVDAEVTWQTLDDRRVRGTFTRRNQTVTADLTFGDDHEVVDFVSDDRAAASADGSTFTPRRWSTPLSGYRDGGHGRLAGYGEAQWSDPPDGTPFTYLEFFVDELETNITTPTTAPAN